MRPVLAAALVIVLGSSWSRAEDAKPDQYAPMPWHLVDIWWDIGQDQPFKSYSINVSIIPKLTVTFGNLKVNGQLVEKPTARTVYQPGVPDYAEAVAKDGALAITVGEPVEGRKERRVLLIGGQK